MEKEVERFLYDGNGGNEYFLYCWQKRIREFLMTTSSYLSTLFADLALVGTLLTGFIAGRSEVAKD